MLNQSAKTNQGGGNIALSAPQKEAVEHGEGPLLIAAGAGSGKTRTLTQRLAYLIKQGVEPKRIVAITFTNKAAGEMKNRVVRDVGAVRDVGNVRTVKSNNSNASSSLHKYEMPFIGTFHSFSAKILRKEAKKFGRTSSYVIFDDDDSKKLVKKILKSLDHPGVQTPAKTEKEISRIKNNLLNVGELEDPFRQIFQTYESELERQNAFDFDDLLEKVVRLFKGDKATLEKYQKMYDYVLVDEYQDINTSQYEFIKLLAGSHRNINVVGDDQQSIYGFRWSDFTNFLNFEKDWPDAKVIKLGENYRSTGNIVSAAASLIENNKLQRKKKLWTTNESGESITVIGAEDEDEEADYVVRTIIERGKVESAILYRTNAQSRAIEQALNFNSIPYDVFGGIRFYERKEVKDIVATLRYAMNPKDEISKDRIQKTFVKKVREELIENLPRRAKDLSPLELLGYILKTADYFNYLAGQFQNSEERAENVAELIKFAGAFDSLTELVERISLLQSTDRIKDSEEPPIKLMTIHLAKGLEFDDVYIIGVSEGLLPHQRSLMSEEELEEERRLAYVAMTRARKRLYMSFYSFASRFLYEIPPELVEFTNRNRFNDETIYID